MHYVLAHALERTPIRFLIGEFAAGHIALGPASILPAKHLIPFFNRTHPSGAAGRILHHTPMLYQSHLNATIVMHIRPPDKIGSHRDGGGICFCGLYSSGSIVREKHTRPASWLQLSAGAPTYAP